MTTRYPTHTNALPDTAGRFDLQVHCDAARGRKLQFPSLAAVLQWLGFARPEQRRVLRELSALSDSELYDIGIHRSNIPQIARTA
jgi:uncharacterized protein YjiS (DUF1127 family)